MDLDAGILWDFAGEVVGRIRPRARSVPATVTRVDADGTAWVTTGDGMEAPVQQLSSLVQPGDVVDVQWSGSAARIVANGSDPSAGERAVREARRVARTAQTLAKDAKAIADATGQFFWHDDSGAHVSTEKGNAAGPQNALWNSLGMLFRNGTNNLLALVTGTDPGMDVYDGGGNEDENVLVSVRGSGTRIGYADGFNTIIQAAQFAIRYATDRLFNVSTDGQSVDIYMGGSTAASGTSYTDAKVEAVAAYLNDGCTVDGTAILDPQGVATGYTLDANGFVLDAGGDQFESGKYQGIYYATSTQTFGLEPQLTPQSEIPGAPVSIDMGNTTVNAANGKAWLTGGFYGGGVNVGGWARVQSITSSARVQDLPGEGTYLLLTGNGTVAALNGVWLLVTGDNGAHKLAGGSGVTVSLANHTQLRGWTTGATASAWIYRLPDRILK